MLLRKATLGLGVALSLALPLSALAASNILVVFDASGSMTESLGGTSRINAAKSAVSTLLSQLDPSVKVALRPYGEVKRTSKEAACLQTSLAVPFTADRSAVSSKVATINAVGSYTPTAYALSQAQNDFVVGEDNALILLTDGKETCDGNPAAAAAALKAAGIKVQTYVIGIDVDAEARAQLSAVATSGGGQYFDAKDSASLASSLSAIREAEKPIDKSNTDSQLGTAIRGGNGFETAVAITPGTYHLDHNQKSGDFDYFKLTIKPGEKIKISVATGPSGVYYDYASGIFKPLLASDPYKSDRKIAAGIVYANELRAVRGQISVIHASQSDDDTLYSSGTTGGTYYLLVGEPVPSGTTAEKWGGAMAKNAIFLVESDQPVAPTTPVAASTDSNTSYQETNAPTTDGTQASSGTNLPGPFGLPTKALYALFGVGALIVLILLIVIVKLLTKKSVSTPIATSAPAAPQYTPQVPPPQNVPPQPTAPIAPPMTTVMPKAPENVAPPVQNPPQIPPSVV